MATHVFSNARQAHMPWGRKSVGRWLAPRESDASPLQGILFAVLLVTVFCLLRWLLDPLVEHRVPYMLFLVSVVISTRWAGRPSGIATAILSLLAGTYFFIQPRRQWWPIAGDEAASAIIFLLTSAVVIAALEAETAARRELEQRDQLLQDEYTARFRLERELEQARRLESLGRLAGGVAHDFNNLLTVILGAAELLKNKMPNDALLQSIVLAATRSNELTKQLLGLGRRQMMQIAPMYLNEAISEGVGFARQIVPEDILISTNLEPVPWLFDGDATSIQQVLLNLITNARDALPEGGTIEVRTANVTVDERFALEHPGVTPGDYVMFSVTDSGAGMTEDVITQIFEPFFTTKATGKGTGLGLPVTYGIVKQLRGHILVTSSVGRGSSFAVYLPRALRENLPATRASGQGLSGKNEPLHVLLVEDNELVRNVVSGMLHGLGHQTVVASTGDAALSLAEERTRSIDVLLTDVVMPGMNGPQLAERMSTLRPNLAVVFMSGYADNILLQKGVGSGLLLKKPFSTGELGRALQEANMRGRETNTERGKAAATLA